MLGDSPEEIDAQRDKRMTGFKSLVTVGVIMDGVYVEKSAGQLKNVHVRWETGSIPVLLNSLYFLLPGR